MSRVMQTVKPSARPAVLGARRTSMPIFEERGGARLSTSYAASIPGPRMCAVSAGVLGVRYEGCAGSRLSVAKERSALPWRGATTACSRWISDPIAIEPWSGSSPMPFGSARSWPSQPADVDLGGGKVRVRGRRDRPRTVPFTGRGTRMLTPWVTERQRGGYPWLFPGPDEDHHAALTLPNQVVQRLAEEAFPQRPSVRRRINADGLRQLFLTPALARRPSLSFIAETLGIDRLTTAVRCLPPAQRSAHHELERIRRPWKTWI